MSGARAGVELRAALPSDAAELSALIGEAAPHAIAERLEAVAHDPGAAILVATNWSGNVIGLVALAWGATPLSDRPVARLTALIVAEEERRAGVGRLLVKAASQAARTAGCDVLEAAADDPGYLLSIGFARTGEAVARALRKRS